MGKKGIKRKTQWRTLAITECPQQNSKSALIKKFTIENNALNNSVNLTSTTETNNVEEAISQDDEYSNHKSHTNPSYLKRKFSTSSDYRNDYRNNSSYSYNSKHNSTSSASSLYSSSRYSSSYRRRPFSSLQNGSGRFSSGHGAERTISRGYRTSGSNRSGYNSSTKPLFNEDDYTRISTPRQDVIFKKGYFSQPKKYVSSTDTNTTSSTAASIVSAEESVSTLSGPSLTPEQCSSLGDPIDPEQGFVYSFIDQNGVVYSYVPNGFDQYNGQMMMLPYGYPPYVCSPDVNSPTGSNEEDSEQTRTPVESHETPSSDLNETKVIDEVPKDASGSVTTTEETTSSSQEEMSDNKCDEDKTEVTAETTPKDDEIVDSTETSETPKENEIIPDSVQNIPEQFYNYEYSSYYAPQILYPFMYPQQFVPLYGNEFDIPIEEEYSEEIEDQNRIRLRCRKKRRSAEGNSTGVSTATTEDESEPDENHTVREENETCSAEQNVEKPEDSTQLKETEPKSAMLNVNVKEFIPRGITKSMLNANVQEFHPRNIKGSTSKHQPTSTEKSANMAVTKTASPPHVAKEVASADIITGGPASPQKNVEKKYTELTLAEKIKQSLAQEAKAKESPASVGIRPIDSRRNTRKPSARKEDYSRNARNTRSKYKKPEKPLEVKVSPPQPIQVASQAVQTPSQLSYAQIANISGLKTGPSHANQLSTPEKENATIDSKPKNAPEIIATAENATNLTCEPAQTTSAPTSSEPVQKDIWQTVKHRGKRGKHAKELFQEDVSTEQSFDEPFVDQLPIVEVKTSAEKPKDEVTSTPEELTEEPAIPDTGKTVADPEESTPITVTPASSKKKTSKSKNRKSAKKSSDSSAKRRVKLEVVEPVFELLNKTETTNSDKIRKLVLPDPSIMDSLAHTNKTENEELSADEDQDPVSFSSTPPEFSFDRIFLNKGFARSPMDILKGFDYTYKSKSILKEEEEMVLNVIKSISSNSTTPSPPKTSPATSIADDESGDEKTVVENSGTNRHENGSETDTVSELSLDGEVAGENDVPATGSTEIEAEELNVNGLDNSETESANGELCLTTLNSEKVAEDEVKNLKIADGTYKEEDMQEIGKPFYENVEYKETTQDLVIDENEGSEILESSAVIRSETAHHQENGNTNREEAPPEEVTETLLNEKGPLEENNLTGTASDSQLVTNISLGEETSPDKCLVIVNGAEVQHVNGCVESKLLCMDQQSDKSFEEESLSEREELINGCENGIQRLENFDEVNILSVEEEQVRGNSEVEEQTTDGSNEQPSSIIQHCTNGYEESAPVDHSNMNGCVEKSTEPEQNLLENSPNSHPTEPVVNGFKEPDVNLEHDITENIRKYILQCSRNSMSPRKELKSNSGYKTPENINRIHQNGFYENGDEIEHALISSEPTSPLDCTPRLSITNSDIIITTFEDYETSSQNSFDYDCSDYPNEKFDRELSRSLASSPFENKERILDELDDIVVPKLDATGDRGSSDYSACLNVLTTIIQSRECSLEPDRSPSVDINRKYSLQPKQSSSLEPNLKRQCSLEPISGPCSAADHLSCVDGLSNLVNSRECSVEPEFLKSNVTKVDQSPLCAGCEESSNLVADRENESNQRISKVNGEVILNGFSRANDVESATMQEDSSRILNASISCDRSSGIGSDCEDNQPSSPENTDTGSKSSTMGYLNQTAQSIEAMPRKQNFPINTAVSKDTRLPQATNMPNNVLPNLSESNSVHCDNQSVSYTSSKRSLGSSVELGTTSDECTDQNDLILSTNSKFPTSTECQPNYFPITDAVKQWLVQESKEPTPEPLFRLPDDPGLKDFLVRRIQSSEPRDEEEDWSSTDNDPDEYYDNQTGNGEVEADYLTKQRTNPKNLVGNPLHVSFCKMVSIESDSDYNSDSNDHHGHMSDDNTCKRVAKTLSDNSENLPDKNDLLEFWDDEFVRNPKRWLSPPVSSRTDLTTQSRKSQDRSASTRRDSSRSSSTDVEPYDSLYGKTIDYNQLVASNYEFLSNNILSYSQKEHYANKSDVRRSREKILSAIKENYCAESKQSLSSNNTFYNDTNTYRSSAVNSHGSASRTEASTSTSSHSSHNNTNPNHEKCMKPPEVCCILM